MNNRTAEILAVVFFCISHHSSGLSASLEYADEASLETLRLVQVIFRHGERNPIKSFPTDAYKDASVYWPGGFGQLTDVGKMQQYELGRYLRNRYDIFISPTYVTNEVQVVSSDIDRTIMSVEANLAGFYQPINSTSNWNPNISWAPVPFRTIPEYEDKYLQQTKPCPRFTRLFDEFMQSDFYQNFWNHNKEAFEAVRKESGLSSESSLIEILEVFDTLVVQEKHNLTLPSWVWNNDVYRLTRSVRGQFCEFETHTPELSRLRVGPLLGLLLENIELVTSTNTSDKKTKMFMYSGHDRIIAELLNSLGIYDMIAPDFTTTLIIELHKDSKFDDFYLNIFYRNTTRHSPYKLEVPGCGRPCFLNRFREITKAIVPDNWEIECEDLNYLKLVKSSNPEFYVSKIRLIVFFGALIAAFIVIILAFILVRKLVISSEGSRGLLLMHDSENAKQLNNYSYSSIQ